MFTFYLELRAVAWETKPARRHSDFFFFMHVQIFTARCASMLKGSLGRIRVQYGTLYCFSTYLLWAPIGIFYHGATQIGEYTYVRMLATETNIKRLNGFFLVIELRGSREQ